VHGRLILLSCALAAACGGCRTAPRPPRVTGDAAFRRADALSAAGHHEAAAHAYARFAKEFAEGGQRVRAGHAQFLCGEEYFAARKYKLALAAFDLLYKRFEGSAYLVRAQRRAVEIGEKLLARGDAAGMAALENVTLRAPYSAAAAQAHLALGRYYQKKGRFADAKFEFDAAAKARLSAEQSAQAEFESAVAEYRLIDRPAKNLEHLAAARLRFQRLRERPLTADAMREVDAYLKAITDLGAERHLLIARFHLIQANTDAALSHLREVLETYAGSSRYEPVARELIARILKAREEQR